MNSPTIVALAWALVHFVWQGACLALAAGCAGVALRRARPNTRYVVLCAALAGMILAPTITFFALRFSPATAPPPSPIAAAATAAPAAPLSASLASGPSSTAAAGVPWFAWLVRIWLAGVVLLGIHALGGWAWAQRLRRFGTRPAAASVQCIAHSLRERLGVRRAVRILTTAAAEVPATLGWLRPVVLLPISVFTALTPDQIELLIAHELAHVRRHDYLVNLVQTAVETVLFYHPAVWWLSARIRCEREHCCDDLAVAACGNLDQYVRALAALEGLRQRPPALVLAASGGSLVSRIQRLLGLDVRRGEAPPAWLGALVPAALVLAGIVSVAPLQAVAQSAPVPSSQAVGFLGELTESGYPKLSVDEIIALRDHGVDPDFVKRMLQAGLGVPTVPQLVRLHDHGVDPAFVLSMVASGLVDGLDFGNVIRLRENDARGDDMGRVRALGFGPFSPDEVIQLRQNGADVDTFEALKEAGVDRASVSDAIAFRQNDVTAERIRDMKQQGFTNMTVGQILKLRRGGVI